MMNMLSNFFGGSRKPSQYDKDMDDLWGNVPGSVNSRGDTSWPVPQNGIGGVGTDKGFGFGMNIPTLQLALGGLSALGGLYSAKQQMKLSKQAMGDSRKFAEANLRNQTKSYNTNLEGIMNSRGAYEGKSQADIDRDIERNRL